MARHESLPRAGILERFDPHGCVLEPQKAAAVHGLILAVHDDGVVRCRAFEIAPPARLGVVGIRTRVDEHRLPTSTERECESVRVTVCRDGQISEWTRVGEDSNLARSLEITAENVVPALA